MRFWPESVYEGRSFSNAMGYLIRNLITLIESI